MIVSILGVFLVTPFYSPHGKVNVRRKVGTDIKCDMIARKLNGRGHSYAAAGIIKSHSELLKSTMSNKRIANYFMKFIIDIISSRILIPRIIILLGNR